MHLDTLISRLVADVAGMDEQAGDVLRAFANGHPDDAVARALTALPRESRRLLFTAVATARVVAEADGASPGAAAELAEQLHPLQRACFELALREARQQHPRQQSHPATPVRQAGVH